MRGLMSLVASGKANANQAYLYLIHPDVHEPTSIARKAVELMKAEFRAVDGERAEFRALVSLVALDPCEYMTAGYPDPCDAEEATLCYSCQARGLIVRFPNV